MHARQSKYFGAVERSQLLKPTGHRMGSAVESASEVTPAKMNVRHSTARAPVAGEQRDLLEIESSPGEIG